MCWVCLHRPTWVSILHIQTNPGVQVLYVLGSSVQANLGIDVVCARFVCAGQPRCAGIVCGLCRPTQVSKYYMFWVGLGRPSWVSSMICVRLVWAGQPGCLVLLSVLGWSVQINPDFKYHLMMNIFFMVLVCSLQINPDPTYYYFIMCWLDTNLGVQVYSLNLNLSLLKSNHASGATHKESPSHTRSWLHTWAHSPFLLSHQPVHSCTQLPGHAG